MAGTRFILLSSYVIQFSILSFIAIYITVKKSYTNNDNYRGSLPFIVNRQGVSMLHKCDFSDDGNTPEDIRDTINQLQQEIHVDKIPINFFVSPVGDFQVMGDVSKTWVAHLMAKSLGESLDKKLVSSHRELRDSVQSNVIPLSMESDGALENNISCDNLSLASLVEGRMARQGDDGYRIYITLGCSDSLPHDKVGMLDIDDTGDMLLRLREGLPSEDITRIIQKDLSSIIQRNFFEHLTDINTSKALQSSSSLNFMITLVDSEPLSYQLDDEKWYARDHHNQLIDTMSTVLEDKFLPTIEERVMKFIDVQLVTQTISYSGGSVYSAAEEVEKDDGTLLYTLSEAKAKEVLMNGDLSSLAISHPNDEISDDSNTHHLIALVPAKYNSPLMIQSGNTMANAFHFQEKQFTVSIMNITHCRDNIDVNEEDEDETESQAFGECKNLDIPDVYFEAITQSVSHFGSFVRIFLGLPRQRPDKLYAFSFDEHDIAVNYVLSQNYIAQWEIDNLIRKIWKKKATDTLELLESTLRLIDERRGVAFPVEAAQKIIDSTTHLKSALNMSTTRHTEFIKGINISHKLAKSLVTDSTITELPHFPPDQIFGVFGSLYIPLTLPFFVGLIREWKRYKSLTKTTQ